MMTNSKMSPDDLLVGCFRRPRLLETQWEGEAFLGPFHQFLGDLTSEPKECPHGYTLREFCRPKLIVAAFCMGSVDPFVAGRTLHGLYQPNCWLMPPALAFSRGATTGLSPGGFHLMANIFVAIMKTITLHNLRPCSAEGEHRKLLNVEYVSTGYAAQCITCKKVSLTPIYSRVSKV